MIRNMAKTAMTALLGVFLVMCSTAATSVTAHAVVAPTVHIASRHSQTFYVSPNGSDLNSGTSPQQAWKTIDHVNLVTLQAGDRVLFQGGSIFSGSITLTQSERGTASTPIVIGSYGTGNATIQANNDSGIYAYDTAGIVIQDLNIVGSGVDQNQGYGIFFYNDLPGPQKLNYIQIMRMNVSGFRNGGIVVGAYNSTLDNGYQNILISDCHVFDNGQGGIFTWGNWTPEVPIMSIDNVVIRNCIVNHNVGLPNSSNNTGNGIVLGQVNKGLIEHCVAFDNGQNDNGQGGGPAGIWAWDSNKIVIQHNVSHDNHTSNGADGDGFDFDGGVTNSLMQDNVAYNNDGAGYLLCEFYQAGKWSNNIVRNNTSTNDARNNSYAALQIYAPWGETMSDSSVYGNVFKMSPAPVGTPSVVWIYEKDGTVQNIDIHDNTFIATNGLPLVTTSQSTDKVGMEVSFTHNAYEAEQGPFLINWNGTNYSSVKAWHTATGQE